MFNSVLETAKQKEDRLRRREERDRPTENGRPLKERYAISLLL